MGILFVFLGFMIPVAIVIGVIYFLVKVSRGDRDQNSLTAKEIAVDVGVFLSLVTSIVALISIIFSAIDKKFVDVLKANTYGYGNVLNEDVRAAVSVILVAYPIYLGLAYYKARYLKNNIERASLDAAKYVNYITLVVSALFILGSVVTTIYQYLGGELGVSFFYKILTVLVISVSLAVYNFYSLKRDYSQNSQVPNIFAVLSLLAVMASVAYSVNILGSPSEVRKARFDEKRLQDLSGIQQEVLNYWTRTKKLPLTIADMQSDGIGNGFVTLTDPKTGQMYSYNVVQNSTQTKATGQDCATFYPNKFNAGNFGVNGSPNYSVANLSCEIPSKAVFELCASFETVRAFDDKGIDQSSAGWDTNNQLGVKSVDFSSPRYYDTSMIYYSYNKNPNWNHDASKTCFKRTIDPLKYPQY